jgi:hypothetical protein
MGRRPSNFRQEDVSRAIKAAKRAGLDVIRVEVDPKGPRIVLVVKEDGNEKKVAANLDTAPTFWSAPRKKLSPRDKALADWDPTTLGLVREDRRKPKT